LRFFVAFTMAPLKDYSVMWAEELHLGYSQETRRKILSGEAYRSGGIVRETKSGKVVAILKDADRASERLQRDNAVPLAVLNVSMASIQSRLEHIQAELRALRKAAERIESKVDFANLKMDGQLLGKLSGTLHACHLDIRGGHPERTVFHRAALIECYEQISYIVREAVFDSRLLRHHAPLVERYFQAACLAGVAARDLCYRLNDTEGAAHLAARVSSDALSLFSQLRSTLTAPSALFWREPAHVTLALTAKESHARLASHQEMLRFLPAEILHALISDQA
jgi:hypothetical protein